MRSTSLASTVATFLILGSFAQGQFLSLPRYDNGMNFSYFLQADTNQDGKTDIIGIRSSTVEEITALLGNGTGGFGAPVNTPITGIDNVDHRQFLLGDFNGDGRLDVAVFGTDHVTGQNVVAVLLGNGGGTFQTGRETILGNTTVRPNAFCAANTGDYNGDSRLDIAFLSLTG